MMTRPRVGRPLQNKYITFFEVISLSYSKFLQAVLQVRLAGFKVFGKGKDSAYVKHDMNELWWQD